jgi:hypothetical protein
MAYQNTEWLDEVDQYEDIFVEESSTIAPGAVKHTKYRGTVQQVGTPMNASNFNNMEGGILDAHVAEEQMIIAHRQLLWRTEALEKATVQETGEVTLTNTQAFPFNNSQATVALANVRDNLNYVVEVISVTPIGGPAGEIEFTDRQVNGFKVAFTGSASKVVVKYAVIGGYN